MPPLMSAFIIVLFCVPLLVGTLLSLWFRRKSLSLADAFLLGIAAHFGAYSLIDLSIVGDAHLDAATVAAVFVSVVIPAAAIWFFAKYGPRRIRSETSLARLTEDWRSTHWFMIAALIIALWGYRFYTNTLVSSHAVFAAADLDSINQGLPYWYTSVWQISAELMFVAGTAAFWKQINSRGLTKLLWLLLAIGAIIFTFWLGRRPLFVLLALVFWMVTAGTNRRRPLLAMTLLILAVPVMLVASNLFQTYRMASYRGVPVVDLLSDRSAADIAKTAIDVEKTSSNLQRRQAIWRFNYDVINAHQDGRGSLHWGQLMFGEIPIYIPSAILPGKEWVDAEVKLQRTLGLPVFDQAGNIFAFSYGEVGLLSIIAAPALMILFVFVTAFALRFIKDPFLRILVMGFAIHYAINIEGRYTTPVFIVRNLIIIAIAYIVARTAVRLGRQLIRSVGRREMSAH